MREGGRWELSGQSMEVWHFASTLSMCLLDMVLRNGGSLTWLLLLWSLLCALNYILSDLQH